MEKFTVLVSIVFISNLNLNKMSKVQFQNIMFGRPMYRSLEDKNPLSISARMFMK